MRKVTSAVIALALLSILSLPAALFRLGGRPMSAAAQTATELFTAEQMKAGLTAFIGDGTKGNNRTNRTSFRDGERAAAAWLESELAAYGYVPETGDSFSRPFTFKDVHSQNVTALYSSSPENKAQIILSANYDNLYADIGNVRGNGGAGAMQNGTGVAILLVLAEKLRAEAIDLPFNVRFVFFGASEVGMIGSEYYIEEQMTGEEKRNTALVVNVRRIGGDYTYLYTDEVETPHGDMFMRMAGENNIAIRRQPRSVPYIAGEYKKDFPYATWGMMGDQARFMTRGMNIVSLYGGNLETLNVADIDGKAGNISYTDRDTVAGLEKTYPEYGQRMADAAGLLYATMTAPDFLETCLTSAAGTYDYNWLTKPAIVTGIVIGVLILLGVLLMLLVKHFEKKYPIKPIVRNLRIAVFGTEYETSDEENIFVDVHPNDRPPSDPFA